PVSERGGHLVLVRRRDANWAGWAELFPRQGAVSADRPVAKCPAKFEILGHEDRDGNAIASVDPDLFGQVAMLVTIEDTQVDLRGIPLGDALLQRALLHAVAAPNAADD